MNRRFEVVPNGSGRVGFVFLDIEDPFCAWAVAVGVLLPPEPGGQDISPRAASILRRMSPDQLVLEFALERARQARHPSATSRLGGIFYFPEKQSAEQAMSRWKMRHMRSENFSEVGLCADVSGLCFDSNWITYPEVRTHQSWVDRYWLGEAAPIDVPIWECVSAGAAVIWNRDLRVRAWERVLQAFPDSVAFLELGRAAAAAGYTLGSIKALWSLVGQEVHVKYFVDMRDAEDPEAIKAIASQVVNPHAVNRNKSKGFDTLPALAAKSFVLRIP